MESMVLISQIAEIKTTSWNLTALVFPFLSSAPALFFCLKEEPFLWRERKKNSEKIR